VKSILGVFSSGVTVCRNRGPQSDVGAPFHQPPHPGPGSVYLISI